VAITGLLRDDRFRLHDPGAGHPERAERLAALDLLFDEPRHSSLVRVEAREANDAELLAVHDQQHVSLVAGSAGSALTRFDADTVACKDSFEAARLAAGGAMALADAIVEGRVDNGFAALRPPGHHAERDHPMGFCLFNNVAVVAQHLRRVHGVERVLIVDWDVHHGNGTQHRFYDDPGVMYVSLHQYPWYPGSGACGETGQGPGEGFTVNLPMAAGADWAGYESAFREVLLPVASAFDPDFVLVSAGFDAHRDDPLAQVGLDEHDFACMASDLLELADSSADGRAMLLLEGGYELGALSRSVDSVLGVLGGQRVRWPGQAEAGPDTEKTRQLLAATWGL